MKKNFNPIIHAKDDGLFIHNVHIWSEEKYKLVGGYCDIFTKGMRRHWEKLVYVDLFSGPGYARIKENNNILLSSPLIALSLPQPFDIYIFCDEDENSIKALSNRIERDYPEKEVYYFIGDCNVLIDKIKAIIPSHSTKNRVLTFCFADPFDLNLHFNTISNITSNKLVDILILQAYFMDANRNLEYYLNENSHKIAQYLGSTTWRDDFMKSEYYPNDFIKFIAYYYDEKMKVLSYPYVSRNIIKYPIKNVPLYYLSFYSKHERGQDFYKKVQDYANDQFNLGF